MHDAGDEGPNRSFFRGGVDAKRFHEASLGADLTIVNIGVLVNGGAFQSSGGQNWLADRARSIFFKTMLT